MTPAGVIMTFPGQLPVAFVRHVVVHARPWPPCIGRAASFERQVDETGTQPRANVSSLKQRAN